MNNIIATKSYILDIEPMAAPRPRTKIIKKINNYIPIIYMPNEYKAYQENMIKLIKYSGVPPSNGITYSSLEATFFMKYPKGTPKKYLIDEHPHTKKPDWDNLVKGLLDGLQKANVIYNDSQIAFGFIRKCYTIKNPRIEFALR